MTGDFRLDEAEIRAKVIELLDRMNNKRLDLWVFSGTLAGVLDPDLVEKCMREEIGRRSLEVQLFWIGPCDQCETGAEHIHQMN